CNKGFICNNCDLCEEQTGLAAAIDFVTSYWYFILIGIILLVLAGWKGRSTVGKVVDKLSGWRERRKREEELSLLNRLLQVIKKEDDSITENLRQLIDNVKQEKTPLDNARRIIEDITKELKETTGQEIELVKSGENQGLFKHIAKLHSLNNSEQAIVTNILASIREQIEAINKEKVENDDLVRKVNDLDDVSRHFENNAEIIDSLKNYNPREKNIINNMLKLIENNSANFGKFSRLCSEMMAILDSKRENLSRVKDPNNTESYADRIQRIKSVRQDTVRLNDIFITKIQTLRYLMVKMEELKQDVHSLHQAELLNLHEMVEKAKEAKSAGNYEVALYFAVHVVENARVLEHLELGEEDKNAVKSFETECIRLVHEILPDMERSISSKVESRLLKGESAELHAWLEHLKGVDVIINKDAGTQLKGAVKEYEKNLNELQSFCAKYLSLIGKDKEINNLINEFKNSKLQ
ncbi:MAG: hypothetical protein V1729_06965, partial [Candidatus Woesearchaeota archaeon]